MLHLNPEIALVVKTRNRGAKLATFFKGIHNIENTCPWELIIVDNGSTDDTAVKLREFANVFEGQIKVILEPRQGAGYACDAGWRAACAPLVAFTDDDCYPEPDYLRTVLAVFDNPSLGFAGGRILLYDPADAPVTIKETLSEELIHAGRFVPPGFIAGANMFFRKQVLLDVNGFDHAFGPGTSFVCEEADLILRALAAGWNGKYDPRPTVYHHHRRKPGKDVELLERVYDAGRGACYMKCILFLPQRWQCALYWFNSIRHQRVARTLREVYSALHYVIHQFKYKPNITY